MTEAYLRRQVINMLRPFDPVAVENGAYPGTPDVNFIGGWVELKKLEAWPKRAETVVGIPHYTSQQRVWLLRRWTKGGLSLLLLQVGKEWLLFDGEFAALHVGRCTKGRLEEEAQYHWKKKPSSWEFQAAIQLMVDRRKA